MRSWIGKAVGLVCVLCLASSTFAAVAPGFMDRLASESRPVQDRARDGARRPYQVMQLLSVDAGMTALDVGAGGGWYTRVLSAAVGPNGHVVSQFGPRALQRGDGQRQKELAASLGNTEAFFGDVSDVKPNSADVAVTALNMHHMNAERAMPYLKSIFTALKPGGRAAIIDHIGLPAIDNSHLHRMPAENAKAWIEAAGFEIVQQSDILRTAADDHTLSALDPKLSRNTDRFLFVVQKP